LYLLHLLFLQSSANHRDLHSFPTRRSSDLGGIPRADEISMDWRVLLFTLGTSLITGVFFGLAPLAPLLVRGISESLKDTAGSTTDRKSTRLNSSHVSISYAVFCLQKKKPHHRPQRAARDWSPRRRVRPKISGPRAIPPANRRCSPPCRRARRSP